MSVTEQFLQLVTPAAGYKFLAVPRAGGNGFAHTPFTDIQFMASHATEWAGQGHNVYFALGGFNAPEVIGADGKRHQRTQDNVGALRALWVDLDVKADAYQSQQEAIVDLIRFCRTAALPIPTIVNSGGGVHAYWPFDRDVPRASWKPLAMMFKAVTVALKLKADPSRTSDEASVLRVPGTVNIKEGKGVRPVAVVGQLTKPMNVVELARLIKAAFDSSGATLAKAPQPKKKLAGINADLMMPPEVSDPANPDRIIARCQQVALIASSRGNVQEPMWYSGLQLARHCANPEIVAHAWSDGHPMYSDVATDRKLQQLEEKDVGPTTCAKFDSLNPGVCHGCPHFEKITSPIQLGREEEIVAPAETPKLSLQGLEVELPPPPMPYARTAAGQIVLLQRDEDGDDLEPQLVYRYDLYPVSRYYDEYERKVHTKFKTYQPKKGWYEFDVPNEVLYDSRALAKCLAGADVLPSVGNMKLLGDYIVSYIQELQAIADAASLFMQMGWRGEDRFVVGSQMVTANDVRTVDSSAISSKAAEKFVSNGDLESWRRVVAHYSEAGNEGLLFGFLTAFGAPLFKYTGFNGAIISMVGASGTGKSTVLKAMNSVYGTPDCAYFQLQDTEKSFYRRVGVLNNLPVAFDEITNIHPQRLSDLCYDFTQGRERMRLTSAATERRDTFEWKTIMLASANASLHSRLSQAKADASAESVRVFEYSVPSQAGNDPLAMKRVFDQLDRNYGHAGVLYLQTLLAGLEPAIAHVRDLTEKIYTQGKLHSSERFWAAVVASNLAGGAIAQRLGLIKFDEAYMLRWALSRINDMRGVVEDFKRSPTEMISDWLAKMVPNTLVVQSKPGQIGQPVMAVLPRGELRARFDRGAGVMYVSKDAIETMCREYKVDANSLKKDLTMRQVLLRVERKTLGAGTDYQTGQTMCWVLDMRHGDMADTDITVSDDAKVVALSNTNGVGKR